MGRIGTAAYDYLAAEGLMSLGLDADIYKAEAHRKSGRNVMFADAEDSNFWRNCNLSRIRVALLAMDDIEAKVIAARSLRNRGFSGLIISHALHEDHQSRIKATGADFTYLTMSQAGVGLAEQVAIALTPNGQLLVDSEDGNLPVE